jgi:cobalt-zinc-cadmium efflux system outer membrane protein
MMRARYARWITAALVFHSTPATAGEVALDLGATLQRAASAAPAVTAARGRIGEAEAARVGATALAANPELELEAGPRYGAERTLDLSVRLGQGFELGGRRGARGAVADAGARRARVEADVATREVQLEAALAYYEALHGERLVEAVQRAAELAQRAAEVAERRRKAGDVTDLDVDLAKAAVGRTRAAARIAEAGRAAAIGRLAKLLALAPDDTVVLRGELRPRAALTLDALMAPVPRRADLRALGAEAEVASAELRLARASAWPDVGLWIGYEREEAADILLAGVRVTLPLWQRAQRDRALARAKAARIDAQLEVATRVASREVRDAFAAYEHARTAVEVFEADVLPALDDAERLLTRSLDAGQLAAGDFLLARKELLEGRREHLDHLLAHARARITVQLVAGVRP